MRRLLYPLLKHVRKESSGWSASYGWGRMSWRVSGCDTRAEAIRELHFFIFGDEAES